MMKSFTHAHLDAAPRPAVLWFTGLSGAGKSTIAEQVAAALQQRTIPLEYLDGDRVRSLFPTGFSKEDRDAHIARIGFIAHLLEKHGVTVIASFVSPYRAARDRVRAMCSRFLEIYVATPLDVCERRDIKGLYKQARNGLIANFTGISDPYEPPLHPELVVDTSRVPLTQARDLVLKLYDQS